MRLLSWCDETGATGVTDDHDQMRDILLSADHLIGHNVFNFDLKAAALHLDLDFETLLAKSTDTLVLARLVWPVEAVKPPRHPITDTA